MEKSSKKYLIIIIALVLVILAMGIYIIISYINDNNVQIATEDDILPNMFIQYTNNITSSMQKMNKDFTTFKDTGLEEGMEDEYIIIENYNDYILKDILDVQINYKGEAFVSISPKSKLYENYGDKHKLKSDVINAGIYNVGNSDYSYIYLVNKDGTVSYVDSSKIYEENLIEVVQIEGLKDIVSLISVTQLVNSRVIAIDVYGNMHELSK